jgi:hypothetical protein
MNKEPVNVDSKNAEFNKGANEPALPIKIPLSTFRWLSYSGFFGVLLYPITTTGWQLLCGSLILGHFSSQLNAIIKK